MIYWFCGQPAAGKTTLAKALIEKLGTKHVHIDGDNLRHILQNNDYTREGRERNIQSVLDITDNIPMLQHLYIDESIISSIRDLGASGAIRNIITLSLNYIIILLK